MSNIIHPNNNLVNSSADLLPERSEAKSKGSENTKFYPSTSSGNKISTKIIFIGTPEFSVPILEKLVNSEYKPVAVFCAPDKPVGRRQILTPPPIKLTAQKYNIPVYQPTNVSSFKFQVSSLKPNLIITAAYGLILPKEVLDAPQYGCLNIHPSLLPKYRGPSPIQSAILNGDTETGVTIYKMDEQIDAGAIIAQEKISLNAVVASANSLKRISAKQSRDIAAVHGIATVASLPRNDKLTTPELSQKLSDLGAKLLLKTLPDWLAGKITPIPQNDDQATYAKIITKENGKINWQKSAPEIENQIRAYTPWPGSYATLPNYSPSDLSRAKSREVKESKIKIIQAEIYKTNANRQPGEVFLPDANGLAIQTGNGALIIKNLQLEGGKPLSAKDFLRGHKDVIGQILK